MRHRAQIALLVCALIVMPGPPAARAADDASTQEAAILQIRVVEGDGAIHALGTRSGRPLSVQVSDETGKPIAGVAVSFRLPDDGPGGLFASGMKTEVVLTGADGKASVWGMQCNRTPGPFQIRVTAVKGQSRAGIVVSQYLSETAPKNDRGPRLERGPGHGRVFYTVLLVVAGAAAGGAALGLSRGSKNASQPAAMAEALTAPTQVGSPIISIGKP